MNYHDVSVSPSYPAASFKLLSAAAESNNGLSNFVNLFFLVLRILCYDLFYGTKIIFIFHIVMVH